MNMMRAVLIGFLTLMAAPAFAQVPGPAGAGRVPAFGGESVLVAPRLGARQPAPLFIIGGVAVEVWAPVPPPYDAAANRNGAANPL